ncbi:MAG TPA: response regulator transcription factor [Longimicrobium sp.]|jgi:two-component system response regulator NreC|nr:response regulator transcription factor [Longimicrobium sp.]
MSDKIRILLVDDHVVLRAGLEALLNLEPDLEVVGKASTGEEALERVRAVRPHVVVMDLGMPGMGGLEATRQIAAAESGARVLVLTSHAEEEYLLPVLEAGGSGYVKKTSADDDLISAIRVVARGEVFLYPSATRLLLNGFRRAEERGEASPVEELSEREREVLQLTAEGYSSVETGKKLFLSPKTVDTYRSRLMQKLGLGSRAELVRFALDNGLLKPSPPR